MPTDDIDMLEDSHLDLPIPDWHLEILRERMAEIDRGEGTEVPLEDVLRDRPRSAPRP